MSRYNEKANTEIKWFVKTLDHLIISSDHDDTTDNYIRDNIHKYKDCDYLISQSLNAETTTNLIDGDKNHINKHNEDNINICTVLNDFIYVRSIREHYFRNLPSGKGPIPKRTGKDSQGGFFNNIGAKSDETEGFVFLEDDSRYLTIEQGLERNIIEARDKGLNYIEHILSLIIELASNPLLSSEYSFNENTIKELRTRRGKDIKTYVESIEITDDVSSLLNFRDQAYSIFNALPSQYKYYLPHYPRRSILTKQKCFNAYWNQGLQLVSFLHHDLQYMSDLATLESTLQKLASGYEDFEKWFLNKEEGGCFSDTIVSDTDKGLVELLCFSGTFEYSSIPELDIAFKTIFKSWPFSNPIPINISDGVLYPINGDSITYGDAKNNSHYIEEKHRRMFSCCERKTFASDEWKSVSTFTLIVKYAPCELCDQYVEDQRKTKSGIIITGKKLPLLKNGKRHEYDTVALNILNKMP